jgi:hypothetical protein
MTSTIDSLCSLLLTVFISTPLSLSPEFSLLFWSQSLLSPRSEQDALLEPAYYFYGANRFQIKLVLGTGAHPPLIFSHFPANCFLTKFAERCGHASFGRSTSAIHNPIQLQFIPCRKGCFIRHA